MLINKNRNLLKMLSIISFIIVFTTLSHINCAPYLKEDSAIPLMKLNLYQSQLTNDELYRHNQELNEKLESNEQLSKENKLTWEEEFLNEDGRSACAIGSQTRDLCERCSKVTKSEKAYAYCCINKENVRHWCQGFLSFTYTVSDSDQQ